MKKILITQPSLPSLKKFNFFLKKIWATKVLTNLGPFHNQLEKELAKFLNVKNISLFTNGTIALYAAIKTLKIQGEVITTPYSFVATSHILLWNDIKPIFVDIDPVSLNIDASKIEKAITKNTTAILAVHCYGNICNTKAIKKIADKYNLKVIYDAAHSFGVESDDGSILNSGDLSILSFHATKVFNTFEGGAVVSSNLKNKKNIENIRNFGILNENKINSIGINGKMSELHASIGLLNLKNYRNEQKKRKKIYNLYTKKLCNLSGIKQVIPNSKIPNYGYFPILVTDEFPINRDALYRKLLANNIFARKYFYPLISNTSAYKKIKSASKLNLPIANRIAKQILCLPIYPSLPERSVVKILRLIAEEI